MPKFRCTCCARHCARLATRNAADAPRLPLDLRLSNEERAEGARQLAAALGGVEPGVRPVVGLYAHATGAKCFPREWWEALIRSLQAQAPWLQLIEFLPEDGQSRLGDEVRGTYTPALRMLGAKLAATSLFVIADGGILHLADAAGAHVLGLFRTTSPAQYAPRRPGSQALEDVDRAPGSVATRVDRAAGGPRGFARELARPGSPRTSRPRCRCRRGRCCRPPGPPAGRASS